MPTPLRIVGSALATPTLFMGKDSTHSYPEGSKFFKWWPWFYENNKNMKAILALLMTILIGCTIKTDNPYHKEEVLCIKKLYLTSSLDYKNRIKYSLTPWYVQETDGSTDIIKIVYPGEKFKVNYSKKYDMLDVDDSIFKSNAYLSANGKDYQATLSLLHSQLHQYIKPLN